MRQDHPLQCLKDTFETFATDRRTGVTLGRSCYGEPVAYVKVATPGESDVFHRVTYYPTLASWAVTSNRAGCPITPPFISLGDSPLGVIEYVSRRIDVNAPYQDQLGGDNTLAFLPPIV